MYRYLVTHPIRTFLLLVFVLSWPFLLYGFGWLRSEEAILKRYLFSCCGMLMVSLSTFITRAFVERKCFDDAGWNLGHIGWYLVALLYCAFLWLVPPLAALLFGMLSWNQSISRDEMTVIILSLGGLSLLAGFGEEFGWRGYLIPRLLTERTHSRAILVLVGLIWGMWHCAVDIGPLFRVIITGEADWVSQLVLTLAYCVQAIAVSVALSIIFGALWLKARSIFLSSFFHGYWIGIRDSASLMFSYPGIFRLATLVAVLAAWFVAHRWLERFERQEDVLWIENKV
jgi:membrane protease YdiL (CAAX protease family)